MKRAYAVASTMLAAAILLVGCQSAEGEREVVYEYVYKAEPVPVKPDDPLAIEASPSKGPEHAKVTIVESSDFQ